MPETDTGRSDNLPWVEKYRPNNLGELISHGETITTIGRFANDGKLPHLLFYGPPGTGKTSTILALAKQVYTKAEFGSKVLELNASDDRGIGIVRGSILSFASTKTMFKGGVKLVILDEADAMTKDAQNALRRVIEKYTENVRFCLICNYLSKIIPALQSRCTKFRFGPLNVEQMKPRIEDVIKAENVEVTPDGLEALLRLGDGDMRKCLNILQSTHMAYEKVSGENVHKCLGHPPPKDIQDIVQWMLNNDILTSYKRISALKIEKGYALQDLLTEIHAFVHNVDFPQHVRIHLLEKMSDIEFHLASGTAEKTQTCAMISAFHVGKTLAIQTAEAS